MPMPGVATEAVLASIVISVVALSLIAATAYMPTQPPKSYEAPYKVLGRGVPGGWELILVNSTP